MTNQDYPQVFISYAHEDKDLALQLYEGLRANGGVDPWIDVWEIKASDSLIRKVFEEGLKDCSVFVIILSPASVQSDWVKHELDVAVVNHIQRLTKIVPVVAEECEIPVALRALRWVSIKEGLDAVVREIVDAAYGHPPQKPLIQPPPDRVRKLVLPQFGLSQEASTVGATIANSLDVSQTSPRFYEGESLRSELDLTTEQINDAAEELAARGLVKLHKFFGTAPFNFGLIEPTYALYYTFSKYLKHKFDPEEDVKQVAAAIVSHGRADGNLLAKDLDLTPVRINFAVAYLTDYGIAKVYKELGTAPYDFSFAEATGATRRFVNGR
jgi:hypothetical protein